MFEQLTAGLSGPAASRAAAPAVRAEWHEGTLAVTVDLPGVPREAVKVEVAERVLTVAVEHTDSHGGEIRWSRTLQMGGSLDAEAVSARYVDGRLTVTVPPATKPEPRAITIDGPAAEGSAIEGSADEAPAVIEATAEG